MSETNIIIVVPLFNDWACLYELLKCVKEISPVCNEKKISFVVVDDCSVEQVDPARLIGYDVEIIHLVRNLGHQKAIAVGLSYVAHKRSYSKVVVMDVDGEDRPEDLPGLLIVSENSQSQIVFAQRSKRSEGRIFRSFYRLYKFLFRLLTGKSISFGNFCVIPSVQLRKLVYVSEIWNHFSGGIVRSRIPFTTVPIERGKRFAGESKMNFVSLVLHGLSAVSVYVDIMAVRIIVLTIVLIVLAAIGILGVASVRLFSNLAIPGWASFSILGLTIIIFQAFLMGIFMTFSVLSNRLQKNFIPALEYHQFILEIKDYGKQ